MLIYVQFTMLSIKSAALSHHIISLCNKTTLNSGSIIFAIWKCEEKIQISVISNEYEIDDDGQIASPVTTEHCRIINQYVASIGIDRYVEISRSGWDGYGDPIDWAKDEYGDECTIITWKDGNTYINSSKCENTVVYSIF
jgi:hypothetical protein